MKDQPWIHMKTVIWDIALTYAKSISLKSYLGGNIYVE